MTTIAWILIYNTNWGWTRKWLPQRVKVRIKAYNIKLLAQCLLLTAGALCACLISGANPGWRIPRSLYNTHTFIRFIRLPIWNAKPQRRTEIERFPSADSICRCPQQWGLDQVEASSQEPQSATWMAGAQVLGITYPLPEYALGGNWTGRGAGPQAQAGRVTGAQAVF